MTADKAKAQYSLYHRYALEPTLVRYMELADLATFSADTARIDKFASTVIYEAI